MNINLNCPINTLSYGLVGTAVTRELLKLGTQVSLFPVNEHNLECPPKDQPYIKQALENARGFDCFAPCLKIFHQFALASRIGSGQYIGFPIFELDRFTDMERSHLLSCDRLIACSKWGQEVYLNDEATYDESSTAVVPLGYDPEIFYPVTSPTKKTIFLNIGKWEVRKGHDILAVAFNKAFNLNDNVELWMCSDNLFMPKEESDNWRRLYLESKLSSKIKFINRLSSQEQLANVMRKASFGVFPSRAEGFNLPALEMMACGIPSVITNYSGHTEFCSDKNMFLVNPRGVERAIDGVWFKDGGLVNQGNWATINVDDVADQMRECHILYQRQDSLYQEKKFNCIEMAKGFTWEKSVTCLLDNIRNWQRN